MAMNAAARSCRKNVACRRGPAARTSLCASGGLIQSRRPIRQAGKARHLHPQARAPEWSRRRSTSRWRLRLTNAASSLLPASRTAARATPRKPLDAARHFCPRRGRETLAPGGRIGVGQVDEIRRCLTMASTPVQIEMILDHHPVIRARNPDSPSRRRWSGSRSRFRPGRGSEPGASLRGQCGLRKDEPAPARKRPAWPPISSSTKRPACPLTVERGSPPISLIRE